MAVKFSAFTTRTGTLDASTKIVGYDDPAGTKTNVEFSLATLAANSGIYAADGTIGTTRKALITDTIQFRNAGDTLDLLTLNTNGSFGLGYNALQITNSVSGNESVRINDRSGAPLMKIGVSSGSAGKINICNGYFNTFDYSTVGGMVFANAAGFNVSQDPASMFTLISTTKGMLTPRMTTAERDAINSGTFTTGLTLYNTTDNKLQFYNGTAWKDVGDSIYTGDGSINEDRVITVGDDGNSSYDITLASTPTRNYKSGNLIIQETSDPLVHTSSGNDYGAKLILKSNIGNASYETTAQLVALGTTSNEETRLLTNRQFYVKNTTTDYNGVVAKFGNVTSPTNRNTTHVFYTQGQSGGYAHIAQGQMGTGRIFLHGYGTSSIYGMMLKASQDNYLIIGPQTSSTDGDETLRVTSSGLSVGVGGANTARLHVKGSGTTDATTSLLVEDSAGADILTVVDDGVVKINGQGYTELHANATNLVVSWNDSNIQTVTVNSSSPTFAPTNPKAGATYILIIEQGATPVTVDWNSLVKWPAGTAPTLSSVTGKIDVTTLICYDDSTTNGLYYGSATLDLA